MKKYKNEDFVVIHRIHTEKGSKEIRATWSPESDTDREIINSTIDSSSDKTLVIYRKGD